MAGVENGFLDVVRSSDMGLRAKKWLAGHFKEFIDDYL